MTTTHDVAALRRANPPTYETIPIGWIKLAKRNARKHSATQVDGIRTSMEASGPINPPIVDEHYRLIAGEGRYLALRKMNVATVEVIVVRHLTDEQKRAYAIADNRLAEKSSWNWSALQLELRDLSIEAPQIDLTMIGFGHAEIEQMVSKLDQTSWSDLDQPVTLPDKFAISRGSDIWLFEGDHQLACGDCTSSNLVWRLAGDERFRLVLTDPPYNRDAKSYSGKGKHKHGNFAVGHGEFDRSAFVAFLSKGFETIKAHLEDGALLQVFMDWQHVHELLDAGLEQGFSLKNILVWDKGKGGMGSLYRSGHELICLFKHGDKRWRIDMPIVPMPSERATVRQDVMNDPKPRLRHRQDPPSQSGWILLRLCQSFRVRIRLTR